MSLLRNRYLDYNKRILIDGIVMTNGNIYSKGYSLIEIYITRLSHYNYIELQYVTSKTAVMANSIDIEHILVNNSYIILEDEPDTDPNYGLVEKYNFSSIYKNKMLQLQLEKREHYQYILARLVDEYNKYLDYTAHNIDTIKYLEYKRREYKESIDEALSILESLEIAVHYRKERLKKTVYDYEERLIAISYNSIGRNKETTYQVVDQIDGGIVTDIYCKQNNWLVLIIDNNRHRYINIGTATNIRKVINDR